jgi:hypothetical protein
VLQHPLWFLDLAVCYFVVPEWKASLKSSHFILYRNIQNNDDNSENTWKKFSVTFPGTAENIYVTHDVSYFVVVNTY